MLFAACFAMVQPVHAAARYAGIVVDAKTGKVLYDESADELRYPASLTKMMTLYLVFEALESGRVRLDTKVPVSAKAAAEPPSKLGVRAGGSVTIEQGIQALVTRSANDIATALGEFVGGSEQRFAQQMTAKARALGMTKTTYRNANGLPNTAQMTTARDQARLGIALRQHFPQYYGYFSTRSFKFGKQVIGNHNRLLGNVRGVDGIKTGYTRAAGFNLVTSAEADGRSIVGVVLGGPSGAKRDATMRKLVATYMPKASRSGGRNNLIAKHGSTLPSNPGAAVEVAVAETVVADAPFAQERFALPNNGPVPVTRYDDGNGEVAYAAPSPANAAASALAVASPVAKPAEQSVAMAPAPAQVLKAPAAPPVAVDRTVTSSTSPQAGWVIQIGASPDQQMAMDLLRNAQDKGGKVLRTAKPFTVAYGDGAEQLYRARFAGFDNQKTAVNACKALKKIGIGCWAAMQ